ncbi:MAG: hypothetical protein IT342_02110 [Candidatus Melainabacteria bacterium]|nr:hypothetical protein [Candidatus Melainabacteria bacterium]
MMSENPDTGDDRFVRLKKFRQQEQIWRNRAAMGWQQRNLALVEYALNHMWGCQVDAANIEGKEPPEGPPDPEEYFRDRGQGDDPPWRPYDPMRVASRPAPSSGGAYRSLLPPKPDEDEE